MAKTITQQIVDDITAQIAAGTLKPGDRVPSTAELREQYDASITPVRAAIQWLKALGLVEGISGKGVFVSDDAPRKVKK